MNDEKDKELDDFFRKGLEDPVDHAVYREADWESLDRMLEKKKERKGAVYWLPIISSVAALALLFLGWWLFRPVAEHGFKPHAIAALHPKGTSQIKASTATPLTEQPQRVKQLANGSVGLAVNNEVKSAGIRKNLRYNDVSSPAGTFRAKAEGTNNADAGLLRTNEELSAVSVKAVIDPHLINSTGVNSHMIPGLAVKWQTDLPTAGSKIKKQSAYRPQFALTVLAAPDINGVGSFQQGKVGTNAGLQFSAGLSKFSITTGIIYSAKPYLTNFDDYHTSYKFPVNPVSVTADCRMLDIPLDIGYQVYNKHQNKISIGTGLSSYLMLHENYTFNYAGSSSSYGHTGPVNYTVPNSKSYLMGVFNLNATYERPLSSKINIAIEPYLKLPLTNIGYSQVRLQSTGVAVGLKWNLNSLTKP